MLVITPQTILNLKWQLGGGCNRSIFVELGLNVNLFMGENLFVCRTWQWWCFLLLRFENDGVVAVVVGEALGAFFFRNNLKNDHPVDKPILTGWNVAHAPCVSLIMCALTLTSNGAVHRPLSDIMPMEVGTAK